MVSLRGTQFWRVSDWLEDVRMWTEPVVFSILSVVFPTIRAWSPHTTAMVLALLFLWDTWVLSFSRGPAPCVCFFWALPLICVCFFWALSLMFRSRSCLDMFSPS